MTDTATLAQNKAARPDVSTWLAANAGSGKTKVLTDRVARLLLRGVQPQNILCLTYTKAAASEMQNRLFQTLGAWAMLEDERLRAALTALGEETPDDLSRARTLFAAAIEAPGGLKIQTIHSLCATILRQFPLEAGVTPNFKELDEAGQAEVLKDCLSKLVLDKPGVLRDVSASYSGELVDLARDVAGKADAFTRDLVDTKVNETFRVREHETADTIVQNAFTAEDIAFLKSLVPVLSAMGSSKDQDLALRFQALPDTPSQNALKALEGILLTKSGNAPFTAKMNIPTKKVRESAPLAPLMDQFVDLAKRVESARLARISFEAANKAKAVLRFADAFLELYQDEKAKRGVLDFDDLIRRTKVLLSSRSLSWVLYRLDSKMDHILVDEAQDTSPMQWDVIEALAEEITSGQGDRQRTLFVVGDKKQSIYSFQGADAAGFDARERRLTEKLADGQGMAQGALLHSFRSSPAILKVVDETFRNDGSLASSNSVSHIAFHDDLPGRVDLWPLVEKPGGSEDLPWYDSSYRTVAQSAPVILSEKIANHIAELLKTGSIPGKDGEFRRVVPSDIMVLVQRRSALFDRIIAACKSKGLPMAGADRLKVASELAVRDILALLDFLALPDDSLALAASLRSPLFGWTEQDLFTLAARRPKGTPLWRILRQRKDEFPQTFSVLEDLRRRVDFLRPFELIDVILTEFKGRERLVARLGPEAEDGIDELLNQALGYELTEVPSLTGFLSQARVTNTEIKRQPDSAGSTVRVMTVHGAKGLESPIVILPDTTFAQKRRSGRLIDGPGGLPIIPGPSGTNPTVINDALTQKDEVEGAERDRLLYVAMTRAEKWLIVCGVESAGSGEKLLWHDRVETGLKSAGAYPIETPTGQGLRYAHGEWSDMVGAGCEEEAVEPSVPRAFGPVPAAPDQINFRAPSELGGAKALPGGELDDAQAMRRGRQLHRLFEFMRNVDDVELAQAVLAQMGADAPIPDEIPNLIDEAAAVLRSHSEVFDARGLSEVEITAFIPTLNCRIIGAIDRLIVEPDGIHAIDFKTNAIVPSSPSDVPEGVLRQMGAYLEALEAIFPDKEIRVSILWTANASLMPLKHGIVRDALRRTATS